MIEAINILIIDDSQDDRMFYTRELKKIKEAQYVISEVDNGEDILQRLASEKPDCILLDYSLPGHNGIEVLKQIRNEHPYIPVIMLTGQGNETVAVSAMQEGAQNYISKSSINAESLQHVVSTAIEHCTLHRRINEQRVSLEIFTRALAHDLKEPMRTINSFTEMLMQNKPSPEKMETYLSHIQKASVRMTMLIDTVFLYTQIDAHKQVLKEPFDMNTLLEETKDNLNHLINQYHVEITTDHLPYVYANRVQILQVWQNLITNAIRHNGMNTKIHIRAEEQSAQWLFSVNDNGPGIDPEYYEKIFMPFKRLSGAKEEGAGLGLAICRKAIELHNGKIWCKSQPGAGTTFMFTLPKSQLESDIAKTASLEESSVGQFVADDKKLANILLVDDRKSDIELAKIVLFDIARLQCNMQIAYDGEEALSVLRKEIQEGKNIDLILLDINMPGMDGFELLEMIRKDKDMQNISVIMCTGSTYDKDKQRSESLGAIGYMVKPLSFEKMKPMLARVPTIHLCQAGDGYQLQRFAG